MGEKAKWFMLWREVELREMVLMVYMWESCPCLSSLICLW